jgi:hypothetical protein
VSFIKDSYLSWAWSPQFVAAKDRADRGALIILPNEELPDLDAYLCHFSTLRDGEQYSWIWLFDDLPNAVQIKILPSLLSDDDPIGTLISSTLPNPDTHGRKQTYLQSYPSAWLKELDFESLGIHEIWFGYDHKRFVLDRSLRAAVPVILDPDELRSELRK